MKTKNFSKKLSINKATISNLTNQQMQSVQGGLPLTSVGVLNQCYTLCRTGVCCPVEETTQCTPTGE